MRPLKPIIYLLFIKVSTWNEAFSVMWSMMLWGLLGWDVSPWPWFGVRNLWEDRLRFWRGLHLFVLFCSDTSSLDWKSVPIYLSICFFIQPYSWIVRNMCFFNVDFFLILMVCLGFFPHREQRCSFFTSIQGHADSLTLSIHSSLLRPQFSKTLLFF